MPSSRPRTARAESRERGHPRKPLFCSYEQINAVKKLLKAPASYPVTLKASRSRPLIQAGSVPRPAHVAPVAGSR